MTTTPREPDLAPTDLLDLYDVLPPAAAPAGSGHDDPVTASIRDLGRGFAVIVGLFAVSLAAFVVCATLFSAGLGLAVVVVGLPVLVACLVVAGWAARMNRLLLGHAGVELASTRYPAAGPGLRGHLRRLVHVQSWRDLLHVLVSFPVSIFSFSVAVSWVAGGLGGVTYWFWSRFLPADNTGLPALLGFPGRFVDVTSTTVAGVLLLLSVPFVIRSLVRLHAAIAVALIVDEATELRQQVSDLTESRTAA